MRNHISPQRPIKPPCAAPYGEARAACPPADGQSVTMALGAPSARLTSVSARRP